MKAARISSYGGYEVIKIEESVTEPELKPGMAVVEVHASSINPFDSAILKGYMKDIMPLSLPVTLGGDFAGKITKTGEGVSDFKPGDEVYGSAIVYSGGSGAYAEMASVNIKRIAVKPRTVDFVQAASLALVGSSAIQALVDTIKLSANQKILIHGGAGGIGSVAIQLAKHLGAYVGTTVSGGDIEYVKGLGADAVLDYKMEKFEEKLKDYDAVFDTIGGETMDKSFKILKGGGVLASMKGMPNPELCAQYGVSGFAINTVTDTDRLNRLSKLVDEGIIKPQVDKIFSLEQTKEAFEYKEKNHPKGKVVIKIK